MKAHQLPAWQQCMYACQLAVEAFSRGQPERGMSSYEVAVALLDFIKEPMVFLECFVLVEYINQEYIQRLGE